MSRAVKLNLDRTYEVFDLKPYPHLNEVIGDYFDIAFLNGPISLHPKHVTVGIAIDDNGLNKKLDINCLATSLRGVFLWNTEYPLVGPAVVVGSNAEGEDVDVPDWTIRLVEVIKETTDVADLPPGGSNN